MSLATRPDLPPEVADDVDRPEADLRSRLPEIARDPDLMASIYDVVDGLETTHSVARADSTDLPVADESVELALTSPPYFDLVDYGQGSAGNLGDYDDYQDFLTDLEDVWTECYRSIVPGGRLCVVVGDVLRSRSTHGRHEVLPLHADITRSARSAGFESLAPIFWYKIGNVSPEEGDNARFLGKPYEPGAVVKNDVEYILLLRKPGGYRSPNVRERILSLIDVETHRHLFRQVWTDVPGAARDSHPAPFPVELAARLIRMFSFVGDTVLDPFGGSGSTAVAADRLGRNSISIDIEAEYLDHIRERIWRRSA